MATVPAMTVSSTACQNENCWFGQMVLDSSTEYSYYVPVSAASTSAALPDRPDPLPDQVPGNMPAPTRTGRVLGLLHRLIDFGKEVVQTLQGRATPTTTDTDPGAIKRNFGTRNIALILMRIVRGLRLATALEARLVAHPLREDVAPAVVRAPSERAPRDPQPAGPRVSRAPPPLSDVPTAEEIAEALRNRPLGVVIAEICYDLGIIPSNPLWGEILMVVTEFGGNIVTLLNKVVDRMFTRFAELAALEAEAAQAQWPEPAAACGTGPP